MNPPKDESFWGWARYFLEDHLPLQRGVSPHTVSTYRTAFRQFKQFLDEQPGRSDSRRFELSSAEPELLLDFLSWLTRPRPKGLGVSATTRNLRLAALRSFFRFLELYSPEDDSRWRRLRQLPTKRQMRKRMDYLEPCEIEHLFAVIPADTADGFRDLTLLAFLYNTGARASEAAGLRTADLNLTGHSPTARFLAKGRVVRQVPLWSTTAELLERYIQEFRRRPHLTAEAFVFINQRGGQLTRWGIGRRIGHYIAEAAKSSRTLRTKKLSTHSIRHTTAIHLIETGADVHVVRTWLGHKSISSTDRYLEMDLEPQRELLAGFTPPAVLNNHLKSEPTDEPAEDWFDEL